MTQTQTVSNTSLSQDILTHRIYEVRGLKVMIDRDLAELYGVSTGRLNEQVQRNIQRFPADFMFQLSEIELDFLRSQIAISKPNRGGRTYLPYVFTELGIAMLSSVLKSERAIEVNIVIMRTFVHLRELALNHRDLSQKISEMETKYDSQFKAVFDALRSLLIPPPTSKRQIGFER